MPSRTLPVSTIASELQIRCLLYPRRRRYWFTYFNRYITGGNEGGAKVVDKVLGSKYNEGFIFVYFNMTGGQASLTDNPLHC